MTVIWRLASSSPHGLRALALVLIALALQSQGGAQTAGRLFEVFDSCYPDHTFSFLYALRHDSGDLDGDGDLDLVVSGNGLRLLINDGRGRFESESGRIRAGAASHGVCALGDMDGDGDLDLLASSFNPIGGYAGEVLINDGSGHFTQSLAAPLPTPSFTGFFSLELGDVDGDGDLDALVANYGENCRLLLNDGNGNLSDASAQLPVDPGDSNSLIFGDLDADGDLDILFGTLSTTKRLYLNDGAGRFSDASHQLPSDPLTMVDWDLGDIDGDGDLDAALSGALGYSAIYLNDGTGRFLANLLTQPGANTGLDGSALRDVDGDGDLDALLGYHLFQNDGLGAFTPAPWSLPIPYQLLSRRVCNDYDGDGDLDVIGGSYSVIRAAPQYDILRNDGGGRFHRAPRWIPQNTPRGAAVLGDLDGDLDLDAILAKRIHFNDGAARFTPGQTPAVLSTPDVGRSVLGDIDGDGDLDLFAPRMNSALGAPEIDLLLVNDGRGIFRDASAQLPGDPTMAIRAAMGDIDGDGDLDILVGERSASIARSHLRIYLNDGSGSFRDASWAYNLHSPQNVQDLHLIDLDGDTDLDLVIRYEYFNGHARLLYDWTRIFLNDGSGGFALTATPILTLTHRGLPWFHGQTRVGDVDRDGDPDLLISIDDYTTYRSELHLFLNDGAAGFQDASNRLFQREVQRLLDHELADVDGDGWPDILCSSGTPLFLNDGRGSFIDGSARFPLPTWNARDLAVGDLDGDGDLDVLADLEARDLILSNLTRQLGSKHVASIGRPHALELWGPGGGAWQLAVAPAPARIALPQLGTLHLDPGTLFVAARGGFDPAGRSTFTVPIPRDARLMGTELYWQALMAFPLGLSNLERTTLTGL